MSVIRNADECCNALMITRTNVSLQWGAPQEGRKKRITRSRDTFSNSTKFCFLGVRVKNLILKLASFAPHLSRGRVKNEANILLISSKLALEKKTHRSKSVFQRSPPDIQSSIRLFAWFQLLPSPELMVRYRKRGLILVRCRP